MPKRNLNDLVKGAGDELGSSQPLRRGRGLAGMLTEEEQPSAEGNNASSAASTSQHVHKEESLLADNTTNQQASNPTSIQERKTAIQRSVKSFRLRDDLIVEVDVLAARERRKIYEVIEEALELYLAARSEGKETDKAARS